MASEAQHQAYVIKWSQQPSIRRQWPELALLHYIPNGGTRDQVIVILARNGYTVRQGKEKDPKNNKTVTFVEVIENGK